MYDLSVCLERLTAELTVLIFTTRADKELDTILRTKRHKIPLPRDLLRIPVNLCDRRVYCRARAANMEFRDLCMTNVHVEVQDYLPVRR